MTEPLDATPDHRDLTIQERFELYHRANPWVYEAFERMTLDWLSTGRGRVGIGMLNEVLRWETRRSTIGDPYKLNDHYRSRYVRLLIANHPEWEKAFETRKLRAA